MYNNGWNQAAPTTFHNRVSVCVYSTQRKFVPSVFVKKIKNFKCQEIAQKVSEYFKHFIINRHLQKNHLKEQLNYLSKDSCYLLNHNKISKIV